MRDPRVIGAAIAIGLAISAAAVSAAPVNLSAHDAWGAFRDEGRCYAIAKASPSDVRRERNPFVSVETNITGNTVYFQLSRSPRKGASVTLDVGDRRFSLLPTATGAWGRKSATGGSDAIVSAIRRSDTMTVGSRDWLGRRFRDSYALAGAPTAIDSALVGCAAND